MIDFGTSQSPKSTRPLTTYWCPSRPGHQALRNNFASSLLLRTWLPMTGRRVRRPTLFSLWRKARRENSAASRLLGSTSLRFALHGWQRLKEPIVPVVVSCSADADTDQAEFVCLHGETTVDSRTPQPDKWKIEIPHGNYDFVAKVDSRKGERKDETVLPPYRDIEIELEAGT
ncbi:hypothetical protein [Thiolapillus sp.]|uniref:hypothetical protein n=1 Tax=Thiolapillus sp. TaxID=2017437 RepID=UPI003AF880CD